MATIYLAFKVSVLLASLLLPLGGPRKNKNGKSIELSDLAVNAKGVLEDLSKTGLSSTIKIK